MKVVKTKMGKQDSNTATIEKVHISPPPRYNVIFHNDDITPMVFVVTVLKTIFDMDDKMAFKAMMDVHINGKRIVGTYIKSIAETKVILTTQLAEQNGYPLQVTMEEE